MTEPRQAADGRGVLVHGLVAAQVFGCVGAVLSVGLNAPQAWTCCRHRLVQGLSPAARWLALVHSVTWAAYGLAHDATLQVLTNVVCAGLQGVVLLALLVLAPAARARQVLVPQALLAVGWLAVVTLSTLTGAAALGALAAAAGTLAVVPQLWQLVRDPDQDTRGISRCTTALSLLASLCWVGHGVLLDSVAIVVPSFVGAAAAAWTLWLLAPVAVLPVRALRAA